jgi:hypothetical protein
VLVSLCNAPVTGVVAKNDVGLLGEQFRGVAARAREIRIGPTLLDPRITAIYPVQSRQLCDESSKKRPMLRTVRRCGEFSRLAGRRRRGRNTGSATIAVKSAIMSSQRRIDDPAVAPSAICRADGFDSVHRSCR